MSARDAWRRDHHRNLFGTDKNTPFIKSKEAEWQSSNKGYYNEGAYAASDMPTAGSSTFAKAGDYKMQFMTSS